MKAWPAPIVSDVGGATIVVLGAFTVSDVMFWKLTKRTSDPSYPDVHPGNVMVRDAKEPAGAISSVSVPDETVTVCPVVGCWNE
jgi:hypothetical protein